VAASIVENKLCPGSVAPDNDEGVSAISVVEPEGWSRSDSWQLRVMNRTSRRGERRLVHRVSAAGLHLTGGGNCIAYILKRMPA
jgi:hypothetical protein